MFAMIVLDLVTERVLIVHDEKGKVKTVKSEPEAERYVAKNIPNGKLLGVFDDPSHIVKVVLKERDNGNKVKTVRSKDKDTKSGPTKRRPKG